MYDWLLRIKTFPDSFKKGTLVLTAAWLWFLLSLYWYFGCTGGLLFRLVLTGVLTCYFVIAVKNWARILCVLFNSMIGLYFIFAAVNFLLNGQIRLAVVGVIIFTLFSISSVYLLAKESAEYFRGGPSRKVLE